MLNRASILYFIVILFSCDNEHEQAKQPITLNDNLEIAIENYINKNNLTPPCMVHVGLVSYRYDYKAFNISTDLSRDYKYSSLCIKSKSGVDICFYSGLENYFNNQDNLSRDVSKNCIDAGMVAVIDSSGIWKTYNNIGLFPSCELPDIKDLLSKANYK